MAANKFDKGMDDAYTGQLIEGNPTLEYLQGYGYAEELLCPQEDTRTQQDDRVQPLPEAPKV